jgi:catechol 2,3-dioxygenase-like lactoylglutathione lyase family enzyme
MKLSAVRICVDDLDEARVFYRDVLGLPLQFDGAASGYLVFDGGGVRVIVEPVFPDGSAEERVLVGRFVGVSFEVHDMREAYERLSGLGVRFVAPPERQDWGGTLATFFDPAGNQLQLVQYGT